MAELREKVVDYVLRYGGRCRDCADEVGICPGSGLPCTVDDARRAIRHTLDAIAYGVKHGYLDAAEASLNPVQEWPEGWQPIETAPKHQDMLVGGWNIHGQWRCSVYSITGPHWREEWEYTSDEPTHWRPLPGDEPARPQGGGSG